MRMELIYYLLSGLAVFVWLTAAWDALVHLSGGRVRRIDAKDRDFARKTEDWLESKYAYETVYRILTFLVLAWIAVLLSYIFKGCLDITSNTTAAFYIVVTIFIMVALADILNDLLFARFDLLILRITMPGIKFLRFTLFFPLIFLLEIMRANIDRWQMQDDEEERSTMEDEILSLVEHDETEGEDASLEDDEKRMIKGVFDLDKTNVREIMTPRVDIKGISILSGIHEALELFIESGHSRIPVYDRNIDNIRGILYAKDLLDSSRIKGKTLLELSRPPIFIPETKEVGDLLEEIQKTRKHFAVVIDEYGGTAGIVTLEDIIEEIVGEIRDEYDINEDDSPMHVEMPDGTIIFDGRTLIDDVNALLNVHLPDNEDVDTIGGFVCGELGHIPHSGEKLTADDGNIGIEVLQADRKKVLKVKIKRLDGS